MANRHVDGDAYIRLLFECASIAKRPRAVCIAKYREVSTFAARSHTGVVVDGVAIYFTPETRLLPAVE